MKTKWREVQCCAPRKEPRNRISAPFFSTGMVAVGSPVRCRTSSSRLFDIFYKNSRNNSGLSPRSIDVSASCTNISGAFPAAVAIERAVCISNAVSTPMGQLTTQRRHNVHDANAISASESVFRVAFFPAWSVRRSASPLYAGIFSGMRLAR